MQRSLPKSVARVSISFIRLVANISVFANREQYRLHISKLSSIVSVASLKPSDSNLNSFRFIIAVIHFIAAIRNEDSKIDHVRSSCSKLSSITQAYIPWPTRCLQYSSI